MDPDIIHHGAEIINRNSPSSRGVGGEVFLVDRTILNRRELLCATVCSLMAGFLPRAGECGPMAPILSTYDSIRGDAIGSPIPYPISKKVVAQGESTYTLRYSGGQSKVFRPKIEKGQDGKTDIYNMRIGNMLFTVRTREDYDRLILDLDALTSAQLFV